MSIRRVSRLDPTGVLTNAYLDRVPVFIMGATGPMDEGKRRPHIDWTHTALVQGAKMDVLTERHLAQTAARESA